MVNGMIMNKNRDESPLGLIKTPMTYSREITIALLVKFILLGALWWFLFAGNKQTMNERVVAGKIFGAQQPVVPAQINQENP